MKIKPSYYVLVAEILTITLFHAVKIRQAERHQTEMVFSKDYKGLPPRQAVTENKTRIEYILESMVK